MCAKGRIIDLALFVFVLLKPNFFVGFLELRACSETAIIFNVSSVKYSSFQ